MKSPAIHRTPLYRAKAAFANMKRRCKGGNAVESAYQNTEVQMSLDEWLEWAVPEYEQFMEKYPDMTPCVSRNGDSGHYSLDNIRIISTVDNRKELAERQKETIHELCCPECGVYFERTARNINFKIKRGKTPACSRSCGAKFAAKQRNNKGR